MVPLLVILVVIIFVIAFVRRNRNDQEEELITRYNTSQTSRSHMSSKITVNEKIGEGQFGKVYKGLLSGTVVALKELRDAISDMEKEALILEYSFKLKIVYREGT